jgi:hypothetical protein
MKRWVYLYSHHIRVIIFSLLSAGVYRRREKVTPAVGIVFNEEGKIYNLSGSYYSTEKQNKKVFHHK